MRLIDADYACKGCIRYRTSLSCEECVVNDAPTVDAVPVVRCRECKKHSEANGKHYCKFWKMYCPDDSDFFCKARKRKEGADNDT